MTWIAWKAVQVVVCLSVPLWLKFFGSRYQKPGTKDTEVSSDISVDSTVGEGVVCVLVTVLNLVQSPPVTLGTP